MDKETELVVTKRNCLFRFPEDMEYRDLVPVFPELFDLFMRISDQYPEDSGKEYMETLIRLNLRDLSKNNKPIGHNREARYRMVFPLETDRVEFFVYPRISEEESNIEDICKKLGDFFEERDIEQEQIWDQMRSLMKEEKK
ncbi:MAG: hypothetical protein R6U17_03545 [Thermoplasmata archaeon]